MQIFQMITIDDASNEYAYRLFIDPQIQLNTTNLVQKLTNYCYQRYLTSLQDHNQLTEALHILKASYQQLIQTRNNLQDTISQYQQISDKTQQSRFAAQVSNRHNASLHQIWDDLNTNTIVTNFFISTTLFPKRPSWRNLDVQCHVMKNLINQLENHPQAAIKIYAKHTFSLSQILNRLDFTDFLSTLHDPNLTPTSIFLIKTQEFADSAVVSLNYDTSDPSSTPVASIHAEYDY